MSPFALIFAVLAAAPVQHRLPLGSNTLLIAVPSDWRRQEIPEPNGLCAFLHPTAVNPRVACSIAKYPTKFAAGFDRRQQAAALEAIVRDRQAGLADVDLIANEPSTLLDGTPAHLISLKRTEATPDGLLHVVGKRLLFFVAAEQVAIECNVVGRTEQVPQVHLEHQVILDLILSSVAVQLTNAGGGRPLGISPLTAVAVGIVAVAALAAVIVVISRRKTA